MAKRARLIQGSRYGSLTSKVKERMTRTPQTGLVRESTSYLTDILSLEFVIENLIEAEEPSVNFLLQVLFQFVYSSGMLTTLRQLLRAEASAI